MKVLVIGGSKGIGKEIVDHFNGDSLSRTVTPIDITREDDRKSILDISLNYDVVVLHAYTHDNSQTKLLRDLFDKWKEEKHDGYLFSSSSDASMPWRMKEGRDMLYSANKQSLNTVSHFIARQLQEGKAPMRHTNIIFGMLDTERARTKPQYNNGVRGKDICKVIDTLYNLPKDCLIPEFIMEARWINA